MNNFFIKTLIFFEILIQSLQNRKKNTFKDRHNRSISEIRKNVIFPRWGKTNQCPFNVPISRYYLTNRIKVSLFHNNHLLIIKTAHSMPILVFYNILIIKDNNEYGGALIKNCDKYCLYYSGGEKSFRQIFYCTPNSFLSQFSIFLLMGHIPKYSLFFFSSMASAMSSSGISSIIATVSA